ncbi:MAG: HIT domain-containing protein [Planctomycetes bacterium]|nr:HIT domain-containing protein [Planctomycetota bacterium]
MQRIWAPWRLEYILDQGPKEPGCFFCNSWKNVGREKEYLVLGRGKHSFVIMNRFPYNNAHLMVAPANHAGSIEDASLEEHTEMWQLTVMCKKILEATVNIDGCNIGINQGKVAGAGVLDHLHIHIVPRWDGDTNFMPVMSDIKVMPEALEACYDKLRPSFIEHGL